MSDRHEWERDAAVWLAGRRIESALPPVLPSSEARLARAMAAFRAWQAAAQGEADAARFAEMVRARVAARGRGLRRVDRAPDSVRPDMGGSIAMMIEAARARHAAPLLELGVAAGTGRELFDEPCDTWIALPERQPASRYVALRVVGDSMVPLLHSGDVVLVDLDGAALPGVVAVARHPEHGYVVKRVARAVSDPRKLSLLSLNPAYPPLELDPRSGTLLGPVVLRWCAHPPSKPRLAPHP
ncbi:MAG TPA: S24 family peptidase [Gemmatimonadales bacterium]|nr:S24 family peptidase [Gemmatimonadales bacterium]